MNRPLFRSEGTHVCNEPVTNNNNNSAIFQNSRLLLNGNGIYSVQEVASNIYQMPQSANSNISQTNSNGTVIAIPFCYPGGVTFTFQQQQSYPYSRPNGVQAPAQYVQHPTQQQPRCQQQVTPNNNGQQLSQMDYSMLLRQLEQHIMEKMMVQSQQQCKQYQLRFHCNAGTSTSSLPHPCQENYKTTQTETPKSIRRECGCNCPPHLCLHIETEATTEAIEHVEQNERMEPINADLQECKCLKSCQNSLSNSKHKIDGVSFASPLIT